MTAAKRYEVIRGTAELNEPTYFKNALTLKWKSEDIAPWGRGKIFFCFCFYRNKKDCRFLQGR